MLNNPKQPENFAVWRFGIISQLLHRHGDSPPLYMHIEALTQKSYYTPNGRLVSLSGDTLRHWLYRYKKYGLVGLANKQRRDIGTTLVPVSLQDALKRLRKEYPDVTNKRLFQKLQNSGFWDGRKPSRTALYRFTRSHQLNRNPKHEPAPVRTFEYPYFGDMWSADFLHGPKIREGTCLKKTYLSAIIDDATRYIVAASFHLSESTQSFLSDLMLASRRFGVPKRLYTDNGSAFRSNHLQTIAARFAIALPHTPPYKPQGRGKIERFFRTVRDGFLTARAQTSLKALNKDFSQWLTTYHKTPHRTLGMSPLNRKLADTGKPLKQIDPTCNINDMFRLQGRKKVGSDGCVRMWKIDFEVPDALPGELIDIFYLPWERDYILVGPDKLIAKKVNPISNAQRFDHPIRGKNNNNNNKEN